MCTANRYPAATGVLLGFGLLVGLAACEAATSPPATEDTAATVSDTVDADTSDATSPGLDAAPDGSVSDAPSGDVTSDADASECGRDEDCGGANPCLLGVCLGGHCAQQPMPDGLACDDGDPCTTAEACDAGQCRGLWKGVGACGPSEVGVDLDGDACVDECRVACSTPCDCVQKIFLLYCDDPAAPVSYPTCEAGGCVARCGPTIPPENFACTSCTTSAECGPGAYCAPPKGQCSADSGSCSPRPTSCPTNAEWVCGCDGVSYKNDCHRDFAGVGKASEGKCPCIPKVCEPGMKPADSDKDGCPDVCIKAPCSTNAACGPGEYCKADSCGGPGVCWPRPADCLSDLDGPVCGCDGTSYPSGCAAAQAATGVEHKELCCKPKEAACALELLGVDTDLDGCVDRCVERSCDVPDDCPSGTQCEPAAGACAGPKTCRPLVASCDGGPVCGCDGKTWPSWCAARDAGVGVDYGGSCTIPCSGTGDCPPGTFCELPPGQCGAPDSAGTCAPVPRDRVCDRMVNTAALPVLDPFFQTAPEDVPVCGCNGVTYRNDCMRRLAHVSKAADAACSGCSQAVACPVGQYGVMAGDTAYTGRTDYTGGWNSPPAAYCPDQCRDLACGENDDCWWAPGLVCERSACGVAGLCVPGPTDCPGISDPVCGCDNKTWPNACEAKRAGMTVTQTGACPPVAEVACATNADCAALAPVGSLGWFCAKPLCGFTLAPQAGVLGVCTVKPKECLDDGRPVCSCDGDTFPSSCHALASSKGLSRTDGPCPCPFAPNLFCGLDGEADLDGDGCYDVCLPACGHIAKCTWGELAADTDGDQCSDSCIPASCSTNADCLSPRFFCELSAGTCGGTGRCLARSPTPTAYPSNPCSDRPVCGCDGATYASECESRSLGVSLASHGPCAVPDVPCQTNTDCTSAGYCRRDPGDCAGEGRCVPKPAECVTSSEPVCGCDGQAWSSACAAAVAGVTVLAAGACGSICGGPANLPCPPSEVCDVPDGTCGASAEFGVCRYRPKLSACPPLEWWQTTSKVCGCDGKSYATDCIRLAAGVPKAHDGQCDYCAPGSTFCGPGQVPAGAYAVSPGAVFHAYLDPCPTVCSPEPCYDDTDCWWAPGHMCERNGCGITGVCVPRPAACPAGPEACGCDLVTYPSECDAKLAGVGVAHTGKCEAVEPIECLQDYQCYGPAGPPSAFFSVGCYRDVCRDYDLPPTPGTCRLVPSDCSGTPGGPVCTCGGTANNACAAARANLAVLAEGECPCGFLSLYCPTPSAPADHDGDGCADACDAPPGCAVIRCDPSQRYSDADGDLCLDTCVPLECNTDADCLDPAWRCSRPDGDCDGAGRCERRPVNCPNASGPPVCGCDGQTWPTRCAALESGPGVASEGPCLD